MLPVVKLKCPGQQNRIYDVETQLSRNPGWGGERTNKCHLTSFGFDDFRFDTNFHDSDIHVESWYKYMGVLTAILHLYSS